MIFKFELNENEANLIFQALGELPAKVSLSLLNKLHTEAGKQMEQRPVGISEPTNLKKVEPIKKEEK